MAGQDLQVGLIGCGSLGTATVQGLQKQTSVGIRQLHVSVTSEHSSENAKKALGSRVNVYVGDNVTVAKVSDVVFLACPPDKMSAVLGESGMKEALKGKPLISVLAGVTRQAMEDALGCEGSSDDRPWAFRALPNLAIAQCASATAVEVSDPKPPQAMSDLVDKMLESLGGVTHVPASTMNAGTVLCGSTPAYVALFLDGMIDGAVAAGVPREKADSMVAQMLASTASLLQTQRASTLRESVCAMPGCTIQGNLILEEGGIRGTTAKAVKHAIDAASKLG